MIAGKVFCGRRLGEEESIANSTDSIQMRCSFYKTESCEIQEKCDQRPALDYPAHLFHSY